MKCFVCGEDVDTSYTKKVKLENGSEGIESYFGIWTAPTSIGAPSIAVHNTPGTKGCTAGLVAMLEEAKAAREAPKKEPAPVTFTTSAAPIYGFHEGGELARVKKANAALLLAIEELVGK